MAWMRIKPTKVIFSLIICFAFFTVVMHLGSIEDFSNTLIRLAGPLAYDDPELLKIVAMRYLNPPPRNPRTLPAKNFPMQSWKFNNEALKVLFDGRPPGFFVEAGATDGQFLSNTVYLENQLHWTGLLVEPDPDSFKDLISQERNAWTCHSCLSTKPYPYQSILGSYTNKLDIELDLTARYKSMGKLIDELDPELKDSQFTSFYQVQCLPLPTILLALNRTYVDLMVIDIEGGEDDLLKSFPFTILTVEVWMIEHKHFDRHMKPVINPEFIRWFETMGYTHFGQLPPEDYIFVRNSSTILKKLLI